MFLSQGAFCQLEKGACLGSASAGLSFSSGRNNMDENYKGTNLNFSAGSSFGIFVANRFVIGPALSINTGYSAYRTENAQQVKIKNDLTSYSITLDPYFRYYFMHEGKLALFGQVSGRIGYGQQFSRYQYGSQPIDKTTADNIVFGGGVDIGLVYFVAQNIGIETALGYKLNASQSKQSGFTDKSSTGTLAINVGFEFYFAQTKHKEKEK
jgi:hypothetical protein